jgi:hypothetical protein
MRLYKTVLVGALLYGAGTLVVAGCSDDEEPANPAGAGGGGTGGGGTGGGGTGGGGTGGGGSGGRGGSGGGDAATCMPTDAAKTQCKMQGADSGSCTALTECACNACVCELSACEADPGCQAIRACATRTGCCSPVDTRCAAAGRPACTAHPECGPLITGASEAGGQTILLISELSTCVYGPTGMCTNNACFGDGGGGDAGTDASTDSGGGG